MPQPPLTPHQSQHIAWQLTRRAASGTVESLASTLIDAQVDLNPHQVDAALFACGNPLSWGVILADEVGLGKTIEAGLVISQRWAERRRRVLIIVPANLRKQWYQELLDKFGLQGVILEARSYNAMRRQGQQNPFDTASGPLICSYPLQKFDSDTERRFAVILERDALKWFKPAKGQFQIYYKLGIEQSDMCPISWLKRARRSLWQRPKGGTT